ncbi:MAG: 3-deoxy-7-phosphoheptulonate synthase [Candidatus Omnitrophota bacterium]
MQPIQDIHIIESRPLPPPDEICKDLPITEKAAQTVYEGRQTIKRMMRDIDKRMLVIVGPCSIHDETAAYEYADRLNALQEKVKERLFLVMRVYFEKPRTTVGWKGLINDPYLNGDCDIAYGLWKARKILLNLCHRNICAASELLDPVVPQYIVDLICWAAIGARTTESQIHREMASGLSMPVGFKNSTDGNLQIAIDAIHSARYPHSFVGINRDGKMYIWKSTGNVWAHVILRGGREQPNFDADNLLFASRKLSETNLPLFIMVDCSHANAEGQYQNQATVWKYLIQQKIEGCDALRGLMLESHLHEGSQKIPADLTQLKYGVSITDPCIDWETTEELILYAYENLADKL